MNNLSEMFDDLVTFEKLRRKYGTVVKTVSVDIKNVKKVSLSNNYDTEIDKTVVRLQSNYPNFKNYYNVKSVVESLISLIEEAQLNKESTITIENRCCTLDDCPEILFKRFFINELGQAGPKDCVYCGIVSSKRCTGCNKTYYCCLDHQKKDWSVHRKTCDWNSGK